MSKFLLPLLLLLSLSTGVSAQKAFPTPTLETLDGQPAPLDDIVGEGKPTIIAVWATWCQPCHQELDHMKSFLESWENEYGARVIAVSVDKRYHINRIAPLVKRKGWDYDVLVDTDGQLQTRLGFRSIPQMYILDGNGKIVQEFSGYRSGREQEVDALIKKIAAK